MLQTFRRELWRFLSGLLSSWPGLRINYNTCLKACLCFVLMAMRNNAELFAYHMLCTPVASDHEHKFGTETLECVSSITSNFHMRHLPPVTLHHIFPKERDESPPPPETQTTLRRVFHLDQSMNQSSRTNPCHLTSDHGRPSLNQSLLSGSEPLASLPRCEDHSSHETRACSQGNRNGPGRRLIPAPLGTLSKPTTGGYTLRSVLGWENMKYKTVQNALHIIAKGVLDMSQPMHKQTLAAVNSFCRKAAEEFPFLNDYENCWPARDFATMYLKNRPKAGRDASRDAGERAEGAHIRRS